MHHGYAKIFFYFNSDEDCPQKSTKVFSFPEDMKPVLFDFMYVPYAIGLTFGMTDVGAVSTQIRKIILVQALLAFLFVTTAMSAIASLFTA